MDGQSISEAEFDALLAIVKKEADEMEASCHLFPTAFEVETAVAFLYCRTADIMLLETGMGGRLDSTNIVTQPLVTVLTSISMDHMYVLCDTLEKIALEITGIIRQGVSCVSNPANKRVKHVLLDRCSVLKAPYISSDEYRILDADEGHTRFLFQAETYEIFLPGLFQVENAVTAILALQQACASLNARKSDALNKWHHIPNLQEKISALEDIRIVKRGLAAAFWPARLEHVSDSPDIYLDGAHNLDACIRLRESILRYFHDRPKILIAGVLRDKEYEKMMAQIMPLAFGALTVTPDSQRALDGAVLADICRLYCANVVNCVRMSDVLDEANKMCGQCFGKRPVVIAFGSLSYLGELRRWIE